MTFIAAMAVRAHEGVHPMSFVRRKLGRMARGCSWETEGLHLSKSNVGKQSRPSPTV